MLTDAVEVNSSGWLWPKGDQYTWPTVIEELAEIPELVELCKQRRVCVQAGGNGGLWPEKMAGHFETVFTFEPDPILFRCLVNNVPHENVVFTQAAVGAAPGFIAMDRWMGQVNPGANRVQAGGNIPMVTIDSYSMENVDLIQFDIEGYELNALRGAVETIMRCKPVVCLELRNHSGHFGATDDQIRQFMKDAGYSMAKRMNFDEFWTAE
ncbi:FkbM family methyltransferase [Mesorhizobium sp. A556]